MNEEARTIIDKFRCAETELKEVGAAYSEEDDFGSAADLIESLSAQLDQVTRERDAAVRMLDGECHACTHNSCGEPSREKEVCRTCLNNEDAWWGYELKDHWQWRGAEKEVEG